MDIDAQLLDRYARTRDADAFSQLVRRHTGMVFAVARRVTGNHHDAEEVAQGCFLDLARHAGRIHGSLAGWLHTAATHRAINAHRVNAARHRREQVAARPDLQIDEGWAQMAPLIDAALAELPEELRLPLVLHYFEGRAQAEVAEELGVHQSTISRRLETAVMDLRKKLEAAGVTAPCAALPALLAQHAIVATPKTLAAALGKLAVAGVGPAASSGGAAVASGASGAATKGTAILVMKVAAAVILTAAVSTAGVALLPLRKPVMTAVVALGPPPKVVETVPANRATNVDPGTTELRVTFDQPMFQHGWAYVTGAGLFPGAKGAKPQWIDQKTIVLPLVLKPGRKYALSINSPKYVSFSHKYQDFRNEQGQPAEPYPITFTTAGVAIMGPPPKVVQTIPANGATNVDPATTQLRVTFDQPMEPTGISFVSGPAQFPGDGTAEPRWIDQRTIVLPILVDPGHRYALSVNSRRFQGFTNLDGEPATPYPISFTTATLKGVAAATYAVTSTAKAMPHTVVAVSKDVVQSAWRWWPWTIALAMFAAAGVMALRQRRKQAAPTPLRGALGPRRR